MQKRGRSRFWVCKKFTQKNCRFLHLSRLCTILGYSLPTYLPI